MKKGVLRNSKRLTRKNLCQSLFLIKLQTETCNFIKKESLARCFPVNFTKFLRRPLLQNTFGRLLLHFLGFFFVLWSWFVLYMFKAFLI